MIRILIAIYFFHLAAIPPASCQDLVSREQSLSVSQLQVGEGLNYGLVFMGPGMNYNFRFAGQRKKTIISNESGFGFNYMESRGIGAGNINIHPFQVSFLNLPGKNQKLRLGGFVTGSYNYALYPDLQSGYSYWFTHYSIGGEISYPFHVAGQAFSASFRTTVLGFSSRPKNYDDPYFFDLSVGYALSFIHQDFRPGTWSRYNESDFELRWQPKVGSRISFAYHFKYIGYFVEPRLTVIGQFVKLIIQKKTRPI